MYTNASPLLNSCQEIQEKQVKCSFCFKLANIYSIFHLKYKFEI